MPRLHRLDPSQLGALSMAGHADEKVVEPLQAAGTGFLAVGRVEAWSDYLGQITPSNWLASRPRPEPPGR